jgi:TolB-like protein
MPLPNHFLPILLSLAGLAAAVVPGSGQPRAATAAVLRFESSRLDSSDLDVLGDALSVELQNSRSLRVMERTQISRILAEQQFQNSGACDRSECAVEVGRILSVDDVVLGSVGKIGESWSVTLRLVSVQTGEVVASARDTRSGSIESLLSESIPKLAREILQALDLRTGRTTEAISTEEFQEALELARDRRHLYPAGFTRIEKLSARMAPNQIVQVIDAGSIFTGWAALNLTPFFPLGSLVQKDGKGILYCYTAWVPVVVAATAQTSSSIGIPLMLGAYVFQLGRPFYYAIQSNTTLKKATGTLESAWIPRVDFRVGAEGRRDAALAWSF